MHGAIGIGRAVALLLGLGAGWSAPAQAPGFAAFPPLERGEWRFHEIGGETRLQCVQDFTRLFQQRHRDAPCSRFVIENAAESATVHYTCAGTGHGRTTITVETPRLLRIDSQGIDRGSPFAIEIEARRIGACRR